MALGRVEPVMPVQCVDGGGPPSVGHTGGGRGTAGVEQHRVGGACVLHRDIGAGDPAGSCGRPPTQPNADQIEKVQLCLGLYVHAQVGPGEVMQKVDHIHSNSVGRIRAGKMSVCDTRLEKAGPFSLTFPARALNLRPPMSERFTGSFTQQEPIPPEEGIEAALRVMRGGGRLHRYNTLGGELSEAALLEQEFAALMGGASYALAVASGGAMPSPRRCGLLACSPATRF